MNLLTRRRLVRLAGLAGAAALAAPLAFAQSVTAQWPAKPIRVVVAGPAGGSADIVARLVADQLAKEFGQSVYADPKPGAGGMLAVNELVQAPRDGYTVLVGVNSLVSEVPHIVKSRVDVKRELKPVAELARGGLVLVAAPTFPASSVSELIAYTKAHPATVNYASYSPGTLSHVLGLQLNQAAGIDMTHVGYKGSTPALTDLMGGHVPLMFDGLATSLPLVKTGKIKAVAISTPKRSALLPQVPTFRELGYPQLEAVGWMGLWVQPDVPAPVQQRLRETTLKVLAQPAVRDRLQEVGFEVGQPRSPQELTTSLQADYERVGTVLKSINFKAE
jgi:tripartite-type tricarboxylate transporter receptor subunit TctC